MVLWLYKAVICVQRYRRVGVLQQGSVWGSAVQVERFCTLHHLVSDPLHGTWFALRIMAYTMLETGNSLCRPRALTLRFVIPAG